MLLRQDYRNYNKAPDIYTKLEYHKGRANAFNGITNVHMEQAAYELALEI